MSNIIIMKGVIRFFKYIFLLCIYANDSINILLYLNWSRNVISSPLIYAIDLQYVLMSCPYRFIRLFLDVLEWIFLFWGWNLLCCKRNRDRANSFMAFFFFLQFWDWHHCHDLIFRIIGSFRYSLVMLCNFFLF